MSKDVPEYDGAAAFRSEVDQKLKDEGREIAYRPLESSTHFRLIRLLGHSDRTADVACVLRHFDIDSADCPTYTAVSYTWANVRATMAIFIAQDTVGDKRGTPKLSKTLMTRQMVSMLRNLRQPHSDRWLWIDAICINQSSPDERCEQVKLMGRIYSSANIVTAWLGHLEDDFNSFSANQQAFDFIADVLFLGGGSMKQYINKKFGKKVLAKQVDHGELYFRRLCSLTYWTRKWVLQEIALAHTVVLQAGPRTMPIKDLESIFSVVRDSSDAELEDLQEHAGFSDGVASLLREAVLESPAARVIALRNRSKTVFNALHTLLPLCQLHECTEPRDHLYALYNLIGDHRKHLKIDYGLDFRDVYCMSMDFMTSHEAMTEKEVVYVNSILLRLLSLSNTETLSALQLRSAKAFGVTAWNRKPIALAQETTASQQLRLKLRSLQCHPKWLFQSEEGIFKWHEVTGMTIDPGGELIGPQDLVHFSVPESNLFGLATCRIAPGLGLWQFENSKLAFIFSRNTAGETEVVGRAVMYATENGKTLSRSWEDVSPQRQLKRRIRLQLSMAELFVLSCWAEDLIQAQPA